MNLDTWNKLPEDLQKLVQDTAIQAYHEQAKLVEEVIAQEEAVLKEHGVQIVELEDSEQFSKAATETSWEWLSQRIENTDQFKPYFLK